MQTAFMPEWGICEQHSVSGSSLLAKDWSRECITPPDRVNIVERTGIDEAEQLGASAVYNVSSSFTCLYSFVFTIYIFLFLTLFFF